MTEQEEWRNVNGFSKYSVSNLGRIKRDDSGRILKHTINQYGVVCVCLMRGGTHFNRSVPKLVASAFVQRKLEAFDTPINLDGDRSNNRVDNLLWRPRWYAIKYNRQIETPYANSIDSPIFLVDSDLRFENSRTAAQYFGVLEEDLVLAILNRTYVWPVYLQFGVVE